MGKLSGTYCKKCDAVHLPATSFCDRSMAHLDVAKDSRGDPTAAGPAINRKTARMQVLVENGGTVVLGGIFEQQERKTVTKVPFLGELPVVGYLFKNTSTVSDRSELLICITPRIVTSQVSGP